VSAFADYFLNAPYDFSDVVLGRVEEQGGDTDDVGRAEVGDYASEGEGLLDAEGIFCTCEVDVPVTEV
jgi:hypothetical protein